MKAHTAANPGSPSRAEMPQVTIFSPINPIPWHSHAPTNPQKIRCTALYTPLPGRVRKEKNRRQKIHKATQTRTAKCA